MKIVFIMDPLENVIFKKDTTLALMWAAKRAGDEIFYVANNGLSLQDGRVVLCAEKISPPMKNCEDFVRFGQCELYGEDVDIVFVRTDPPFNEQYLMNTWILDRFPASVAVINSPSGIRTVNEKVWAMQFSKIIPATLLSADKDALNAFLKKHKKVIIKPTDSFGGQGVFCISRDDTNANVILETMTQRFQKQIIAQAFVKGAEKGDKRILLLNGEPLGAVLRVHITGDHRNNFFAGGKPKPADITDRDQVIIETLKPELLRLGLYFVGIDILGDYLIEVNVTSPTCLQELNHLYGKTLEDDVLAFAKTLV